jgi:hypothetical protein
MSLENYYSNTGEPSFPVYRGIRYQKGYGLGRVFSRLFRYIMPIIKEKGLPILKTVGESALKGVSNLASDALKGKNFKQSAEERIMETFSELKSKAGMQGNGINRKKLTRELKNKRKKKKRRLDIFDQVLQ